MKGEKLRSLQHSRASLSEIEHALSDKSMKVGELALLTLASILQHPDFPEEVLESFRKTAYSRKVFGLSQPLLIRKRDWSKGAQYYANYLYCNGKYYCLSSAWFETHRAKLVAWVRRHKIDLDERRKDWQLKGVASLTPRSRNAQQTWVFDFGAACKKSPQTCIKEMSIPKKLIEMLARQNRKCIFQGTLDDKILLFTIDALTLDREFWRDVNYYTSNKLDNRWRYYLNVCNGELYSRFGRMRMTFGRCSKQEVSTRLGVSSFCKAPYKGESQEAQPVGPVCPSRAERLLKCQAAAKNGKKKKSNAKKKNKATPPPKKNEGISPPLKIQLSPHSTERQYIKIYEAEVAKKERVCLFTDESGHAAWEISAKELISGLKNKRMEPIPFANEGECWAFYLDGQTGEVYKFPTGGSVVMNLKPDTTPYH